MITSGGKLHNLGLASLAVLLGVTIACAPDATADTPTPQPPPTPTPRLAVDRERSDALLKVVKDAGGNKAWAGSVTRVEVRGEVADVQTTLPLEPSRAAAREVCAVAVNNSVVPVKQVFVIGAQGLLTSCFPDAG